MVFKVWGAPPRWLWSYCSVDTVALMNVRWETALFLIDFDFVTWEYISEKTSTWVGSMNEWGQYRKRLCIFQLLSQWKWRLYVSNLRFYLLSQHLVLLLQCSHPSLQLFNLELAAGVRAAGAHQFALQGTLCGTALLQRHLERRKNTSCFSVEPVNCADG